MPKMGDILFSPENSILLAYGLNLVNSARSKLCQLAVSAASQLLFLTAHVTVCPESDTDGLG